MTLPSTGMSPSMSEWVREKVFSGLSFTSRPPIASHTHNGARRRAFRCGASSGLWGSSGLMFQRLSSGSTNPGITHSTCRVMLSETCMSEYPSVMTALCMTPCGNLLSPKVTQNHKGEYLIEYRFFEYKLGYFVAEDVEQSILVTTFLFLTMQGTPEASALYERLRLRRPDIEQLGLDSLGNYLYTDLKKDSELVSIFETCGCGHLLKMARPETQPEWVSGYARDVRKYLGMKVTNLSSPGVNHLVHRQTSLPEGYKPRGNYQGLLATEVESFLDQRPGFLEQLAAARP